MVFLILENKYSIILRHMSTCQIKKNSISATFANTINIKRRGRTGSEITEVAFSKFLWKTLHDEIVEKSTSTSFSLKYYDGYVMLFYAFLLFHLLFIAKSSSNSALEGSSAF